jgi:hypothetical protein
MVAASPFSGCGKDCSAPADGCPCDPAKDKPFCSWGPGPSVGFSCEGGQWRTGPDGPCMPGWDGGQGKDAPMSLDLATPVDGAAGLDSGGAIDAMASFDASDPGQ